MPDLFRQIGNFICLALLQILVLNKMHLFDVATPFVYFYVLLKLPSSVSRNGLLLWGFCSGLVVDTFSDTPGMNAAATTLLAFVRPRLLSLYMNKADLEEYVPGEVTTYDGLCNSRGEVLFAASHITPSSIMDMVNNADDCFYYVNQPAAKDVCRAGQAVLVTVGMSLLIALFAGALSMLLSKLLRRGVPALALPLGLLLLSMIFEPPFYYYDRVRAQIWSYMPIQRLYQTFLADERLVSLGGVQLDCIPVSVLLYGGLAAVALVTCIWLCKARAVDKM